MSQITQIKKNICAICVICGFKIITEFTENFQNYENRTLSLRPLCTLPPYEHSSSGDSLKSRCDFLTLPICEEFFILKDVLRGHPNKL